MRGLRIAGWFVFLFGVGLFTLFVSNPPHHQNGVSGSSGITKTDPDRISEFVRKAEKYRRNARRVAQVEKDLKTILQAKQEKDGPIELNEFIKLEHRDKLKSILNRRERALSTMEVCSKELFALQDHLVASETLLKNIRYAAGACKSFEQIGAEIEKPIGVIQASVHSQNSGGNETIVPLSTSDLNEISTKLAVRANEVGTVDQLIQTLIASLMPEILTNAEGMAASAQAISGGRLRGNTLWVLLGLACFAAVMGYVDLRVAQWRHRSLGDP